MTRRILVTRPHSPADELVGLLAGRGFAPVAVPTIAIDETPCVDAVDELLRGLTGAAWLVFTSAHGVAAVADRVNGSALGDPSLRVAAVGPRTAEALASCGIRVDAVPDTYRNEAVAACLGDVRGRRVVIAAAESAEDALPRALRARGAAVDEVAVYRIVEGPSASRDGFQAALHRGLDGVAFTSGSTVRGLMRLASPVERVRARAIPAFCIGPPTADTARRLGFDIAATATHHTSAGLADAISLHFSERGS